MPIDGKVPFKTRNVLLGVNGVDVGSPLRKVLLDDQVLDGHADLIEALLLPVGNIFDIAPLLNVVNFVVAIFCRSTLA